MRRVQGRCGPPKQPKSLPKALTDREALKVVTADAQTGRGALDRGAQCRSADPALWLRPADSGGAGPDPRRFLRTGDVAQGHRKGRQDTDRADDRRRRRSGRDLSKALPLPYRAGEPIFRGARGAKLQPAIIQREMQKLRAALGLPIRRHRTRCATLSRRIFWPGGGISAPSRNCSAMQPVDHAGLYRRRFGTASGNLRPRPSARLNLTSLAVNQAC